MLAANEAVAEFLNGQELNFLRRIHEPPDPRKLQALTEFVRELGIDCDSLVSRFEIKRVVEQVRNDPAASTRSISPCCGVCRRPSTRPSKKATTP
jgi:ribonuclease R